MNSYEGALPGGPEGFNVGKFKEGIPRFFETVPQTTEDIANQIAEYFEDAMNQLRSTDIPNYSKRGKNRNFRPNDGGLLDDASSGAKESMSSKFFDIYRRDPIYHGETVDVKDGLKGGLNPVRVVYYENGKKMERIDYTDNINIPLFHHPVSGRPGYYVREIGSDGKPVLKDFISGLNVHNHTEYTYTNKSGKTSTLSHKAHSQITAIGDKKYFNGLELHESTQYYVEKKGRDGRVLKEHVDEKNVTYFIHVEGHLRKFTVTDTIIPVGEDYYKTQSAGSDWGRFFEHEKGIRVLIRNNGEVEFYDKDSNQLSTITTRIDRDNFVFSGPNDIEVKFMNGRYYVVEKDTINGKDIYVGIDQPNENGQSTRYEVSDSQLSTAPRLVEYKTSSPLGQLFGKMSNTNVQNPRASKTVLSTSDIQPSIDKGLLGVLKGKYTEVDPLTGNSKDIVAEIAVYPPEFNQYIRSLGSIIKMTAPLGGTFTNPNSAEASLDKYSSQDSINELTPPGAGFDHTDIKAIFEFLGAFTSLKFLELGTKAAALGDVVSRVFTIAAAFFATSQKDVENLQFAHNFYNLFWFNFLRGPFLFTAAKNLGANRGLLVEAMKLAPRLNGVHTRVIGNETNESQTYKFGYQIAITGLWDGSFMFALSEYTLLIVQRLPTALAANAFFFAKAQGIAKEKEYYEKAGEVLLPDQYSLFNSAVKTSAKNRKLFNGTYLETQGDNDVQQMGYLAVDAEDIYLKKFARKENAFNAANILYEYSANGSAADTLLPAILQVNKLVAALQNNNGLEVFKPAYYHVDVKQGGQTVNHQLLIQLRYLGDFIYNPLDKTIRKLDSQKESVQYLGDKKPLDMSGWAERTRIGVSPSLASAVEALKRSARMNNNLDPISKLPMVKTGDEIIDKFVSNFGYDSAGNMNDANTLYYIINNYSQYISGIDPKEFSKIVPVGGIEDKSAEAIQKVVNAIPVPALLGLVGAFKAGTTIIRRKKNREPFTIADWAKRRYQNLKNKPKSNSDKGNTL